MEFSGDGVMRSEGFKDPSPASGIPDNTDLDPIAADSAVSGKCLTSEVRRGDGVPVPVLAQTTG